MHPQHISNIQNLNKAGTANTILTYETEVLKMSHTLEVNLGQGLDDDIKGQKSTSLITQMKPDILHFSALESPPLEMWACFYTSNF